MRELKNEIAGRRHEEITFFRTTTSSSGSSNRSNIIQMAKNQDLKKLFSESADCQIGFSDRIIYAQWHVWTTIYWTRCGNLSLNCSMENVASTHSANVLWFQKVQKLLDIVQKTKRTPMMSPLLIIHYNKRNGFAQNSWKLSHGATMNKPRNVVSWRQTEYAPATLSKIQNRGKSNWTF